MQWGHVISAPTIKCSNLLGRAKNKKKGGQLTCEGCGTLHITVRDDLKRTWSRITRLQHKQSGAEGVHTKQTSGRYGPMKWPAACARRRL